MKQSTCMWALAAAAILTGCKADSGTHHAESMNNATQPASTQPATPAYSGPQGTVTGTVSFAGTPPKYPAIDTSMDPACSMSLPAGQPATLPVEQIVVNHGHLANVFIYVKSGPGAAMRTGFTNTPPAVLDQQNCRYVPHVLGVVAGGSVEFRNSDPTMHNVHTTGSGANQEVDVSMGPRGRSVIKQFKHPELMIPVRCNNHPWMQAYLNVSQTPFFAVSDADGHFTLHGLPPGDYTLGAVQEKLGEKELHVTVASNATASANLTYAQ